MASRAVTPPSSPTRWSGSRARTSRHYASRQAPTRSPPSSRRPTTSWLRPTPTVTCPLHLLLRRRELRRILIPRTSVNKGNKEGRRCYSPALDNSLLGPPTCRGLPPSPARHRCGGAPSSIPRLHAGRCSSPANRRVPARLRSSLGHVRCPRCMRHRHPWEPLPPHPPPVDDLRLAHQRSLVRPAPSWLSLLPIRAIDYQTGAWRTRLSRVTRPPSSARDHH